MRRHANANTDTSRLSGERASLYTEKSVGSIQQNSLSGYEQTNSWLMQKKRRKRNSVVLEFLCFINQKCVQSTENLFARVQTRNFVESTLMSFSVGYDVRLFWLGGIAIDSFFLGIKLVILRASPRRILRLDDSGSNQACFRSARHMTFSV